MELDDSDYSYGDSDSFCESDADMVDPSPLRDGAPNFKDHYTNHDVVLVANGIRLYAFKEVLKAHSGFFRAMFGGNFAENGAPCVELADVAPEDLELFLCQIHSGCEITVDNVVRLMRLADRFISPSVFTACCNTVLTASKAQLDSGSTILELLEIAVRLNLKDIKRKLASYYFNTAKKVRCGLCNGYGTCPNKWSHPGSTDLAGLHLPMDHYCLMNKDEIVNLEPSSAAFILTSLLKSSKTPYEYMSYERKVLYPDDLIKRWWHEGKEHLRCDRNSVHAMIDVIDSVIVTTDDGVKHYVQSQVVSSVAHWFRTRLRKNCELLVADLSSAQLCLFLSRVHGYQEFRTKDCCMLLLNLASRFEAPPLCHNAIQNVHKWYKKKFDEEEIEEPEKLLMLETAIQYNLKSIKKLYYKYLLRNNYDCPCCGYPDCCTLMVCNENAPTSHRFHKESGFYTRSGSELMRGRKIIYRMSPETKKFILTCLLGKPVF